MIAFIEEQRDSVVLNAFDIVRLRAIRLDAFGRRTNYFYEFLYDGSQA